MCYAADESLETHAARYRAEVLGAQPAQPLAASPAAATPPGSIWTQVVPLLIVVGDTPSDEATTQPTYVPWPHRRGQAYPDDDLHTFGRDGKEMLPILWDDVKFTFTHPVVIVGLLGAGAAGITINATGVDDAVARRTDGHRQLSKSMDGIGGFFGSPAFHFPLAATMYATGLWTDETKLYETSKTLMNALIINSVLNVSLKVACRTESPNGDEMGWPSGHTSSSFCVAAVMNEAYGLWIGVPLYAFAAFVGFERIDARNHDFSDVISGMIMGTVIGWAVATRHEPRIFGMDVLPMADPSTGAFGIMLAKQW